jgi:hypothetical protein
VPIVIILRNRLSWDYQSITFWCNREEREVKLNITLYKDKLDNEITSKVVLEKPSDIDIGWVDKCIAMESEYPISFILESKTFKKKVTDAAGLGPKLRIEKNGSDGPLTFVTEYDDSAGVDNDVFNNAVLIALESTIDDTDLFSTTVYLNNLKPLAGALVSDELKISANKYDPLIFTALLDCTGKDTETCVIRVLTPVIDNR